MARKDSSVVGIDLSEREIRVVEMALKAGRASIMRARSAPMPPGAYAHGQVVNPGVVGFAIRHLLDEMGAGSVERAVFGVPNSRTTYRQFVVPPVPDQELDAIIAAEVDHHGFVRTQGGAYGWIKLQPPTHQDRHDATTVACFGIEVAVTAALREVAERANLTVAALEPTTLSMLRTALLGLTNPATVFNLAIGNTSSDAAFLVSGQLVAMRRLDAGAQTIYQPSPSRVALRQNLADQIGSDPGRGVEDINLSAVAELALEVRRTLDYLQREYPDFAVVDRIGISLDMPELAPLADLLSDRLSIPCFNVLPHSGGTDAAEATVELSGAQGARYAVAYGLAMYEAPSTSIRVPKIDLFGSQRTAVQEEETRRNFAGSIVVSILGLVVGIIGFYLYSKMIDQVQLETSQTVAQTTLIKSQTDSAVALRAKKANQFRALRKEGAPVGVLMDYMVASLSPGVGLTTVAISSDLRVTIAGEALEERQLLDTVENLKRTPLVKDLSISSFTRAKTGGSAINFQLNGLTLSSNHIKLPPVGDVPR